MWVATVRFAVSPDDGEIEGWSTAAEALDGSVAYAPGRGLDVTLWLAAEDLTAAVEVATATATRLIGVPAVGIEVRTEADCERDANAPTLPDLLSGPDVADILGVSRQRVHQLRAHKDFPLPLVELRTGPVWDARAIDWFKRHWDRKPGRPAAS